MNLPITQHSLEKLEELYKQLGFKVRYEKGNFRTGACLLDSSRMIVVNKFSDLESRISSLAALIREISIDELSLDEKNKQFYYGLKQTELKL
jgi:hypothetical protein